MPCFRFSLSTVLYDSYFFIKEAFPSVMPLIVYNNGGSNNDNDNNSNNNAPAGSISSSPAFSFDDLLGKIIKFFLEIVNGLVIIL